MVDSDPWLLLALVILLLALLAVPCLCYVIWADANARGANGGVWVLLTLVFPPIVALVYAIYR